MAQVALRTGRVTARRTLETWESSRRIRSNTATEAGQTRSGFTSPWSWARAPQDASPGSTW